MGFRRRLQWGWKHPCSEPSVIAPRRHQAPRGKAERRVGSGEWRVAPGEDLHHDALAESSREGICKQKVPRSWHWRGLAALRACDGSMSDGFDSGRARRAGGTLPVVSRVHVERGHADCVEPNIVGLGRCVQRAPAGEGAACSWTCDGRACMSEGTCVPFRAPGEPFDREAHSLPCGPTSQCTTDGVCGTEVAPWLRKNCERWSRSE